MQPMTTLTATTAVLGEANIDTDQIVPARFLSTISRGGLAQAAFADWRFDVHGQEREDCPLNRPEAKTAEILVAGMNFGCGSSREHAVWALQQLGFRAVVSSRLADIFRANALKNGLLAVEVDAETHARLLDRPGARLTIDVAKSTLRLPDESVVTFDLDPFARRCLLEGIDALGYLLAREDRIRTFENRRIRSEAG